MASRLFGDRARFGLTVQAHDPDWQAWQRLYLRFYEETQKAGVGRFVNDAGYRILRHVNLDNRAIFEIGPGQLPHIEQWRGSPASYALLDNNPQLVERAAGRLRARGIPSTVYDSQSLADSTKGQFDVALSFYSLEHLYPLEWYLDIMDRVLRPGGLLIGAIPGEGGLAWGLGRFLTTRRYLRRHSSANPDKIVCWEHPNFAETVLRTLDRTFDWVRLEYRPLGLPAIDATLVVKFMYRKRVAG